MILNLKGNFEKVLEEIRKIDFGSESNNLREYVERILKKTTIRDNLQKKIRYGYKRYNLTKSKASSNNFLLLVKSYTEKHKKNIIDLMAMISLAIVVVQKLNQFLDVIITNIFLNQKWKKIFN